MALGDPYGEILPLVDRFGSKYFTDLQRVHVEASRAVERFCRRQFNKTTVATPRRFRPVDWRRLPVDDFHTVTGLAIVANGTVWDVSAVDIRPWDGVVDGQLGWPFYELRAEGRSWPQTGAITVTAQWGWPAVPGAVIQATQDHAAAMFSAGGSSSNPVRSESVGPYQITYEVSTAATAVDEVPAGMAPVVPYRRRRFGVA